MQDAQKHTTVAELDSALHLVRQAALLVKQARDGNPPPEVLSAAFDNLALSERILSRLIATLEA